MRPMTPINDTHDTHAQASPTLQTFAQVLRFGTSQKFVTTSLDALAYIRPDIL